MDLRSLLDGATKGFKYIKETVDITVRGYHSGNVQEMQDGLHVLNVWAQEFAKVEASGGLSMIFDSDPFHGSRHAAQELGEKYPK